MNIQGKKTCPFLGDPSAECHVADLNSQNIEKAMYFCWGNFERCEIYAQRMRQYEGKAGLGGTEFV